MFSKTERRVYYFVLTMVVLSFVIICILPLFRLTQYLWPYDSGHDVTEFVLSAPRQNEILNLSQLFSADTICVVPPDANVNELIRRALPKKQISVPGEDDDYSSNAARWRIVASWDATPLVKVSTYGLRRRQRENILWNYQIKIEMRQAPSVPGDF